MRFEHSGGKRGVLEDLLAEGMVLVTLDARLEDVSVPDHLRGDPQLRLNLSYRFGLPLSFDDDGVDSTLTFGGVRYSCHLPWRSIYMLVAHSSGQPILFPEDVPDSAQIDASPATPAPRPARAKLQVVHGDRADDGPVPAEAATIAEPVDVADAVDTSDESPPPPPPSRPSRGHLRVVK